MSCYFLGHITIRDQEKYQKYIDGFTPVFAKFQGKVVAADDNPTILEGSHPYTRVVLIQFPNEEEALRWYNSPEYQELVKHRHRASKADIVLVHGRE